MLIVQKLSPKIILKPLFVLIFSAVFLSTLSDQIIALKLEAIISSKDGLSNLIWLLGSVSLVNAILLPMLTALLGSFLIVNFETKAEGSFQFMKKNFELLTIETLRSWGKAFLWSFVFVFPGIWKFFAFTMTPYVVLFSKKYLAGEVDALEYSSKIYKKHWKVINSWQTLFYFVLPVLMYFLLEPYRIIADTPVKATMIVLLKASIEIFFHYQMLKVFVQFINEAENTPVDEPSEPPPSTEIINETTTDALPAT